MTAHLLVFTRTTGYRHESIEAGVAALDEIGAHAGFDTHHTENPAAFHPADLAGFAAVVFLSTSGTVFDDDHQRAALRDFVHGGGGFVGIHAASTAERDWPFYRELVGARFTDHPHVQAAAVHVEDRAHPSTAHLDNPWNWTDEWYNFDADPTPDVHVLLTVDESTYEGGKMGAGHAIAWCRRVGEGRCFYTALGHTIEAYSHPAFREHLRGGIADALGVDADEALPPGQGDTL